MRINLFGLDKDREKWQNVKKNLYNVWIGSTSGPILPMWFDVEFNRQFKKFKKEHKLEDILPNLTIL